MAGVTFGIDTTAATADELAGLDPIPRFHRLDVWAAKIAAKGKPMMIENCHDNTSFPIIRDASGKVRSAHLRRSLLGCVGSLGRTGAL